jgi:putative flippase GtrA
VISLRPDARILARQFRNFVGVGAAAAVVHYGLLIGLVEAGAFTPVPATLVGYGAGGIVSYAFNRSLTYESKRPHAEATWRFVIVASIGFALTWLFMGLLAGRLKVPYLPAQLATTGIVLFWNFVANKVWTFRTPPAPVP